VRRADDGRDRTGATTYEGAEPVDLGPHAPGSIIRPPQVRGLPRDQEMEPERRIDRTTEQVVRSSRLSEPSVRKTMA